MKVIRVRVSDSLLTHRAKGWEKVHEEGRCRMCERSFLVRSPTRHHLIPQHWFNRRSFVIAVGSYGSFDGWYRNRLRDADANIIPLCGPCHVQVENEESARRMLRKRLGSVEVAYANVIRPGWLDVVYPATKKPVKLMDAVAA